MNLAAVYSRELGDQILTFVSSGWTYRRTFVLYDRETESMWYHLRGESQLTCISGPLADNKLDEFESTVTRWNYWLKTFPQSKFLKTPED